MGREKWSHGGGGGGKDGGCSFQTFLSSHYGVDNPGALVGMPNPPQAG